MAYATQTDIETLYGADALALVADRDGDGTVETAAVDRALSDASAEIDAYLRVRYDTPVDPVPQLLVQLACDVALYRLAQTADVRTEEHRTRYEDAMAALKRLSSGQMMLPPPPPDPDDDSEPLDGPRPIVTLSEKIFTRDKMKGL